MNNLSYYMDGAFDRRREAWFEVRDMSIRYQAPDCGIHMGYGNYGVLTTCKVAFWERGHCSESNQIIQNAGSVLETTH